MKTTLKIRALLVFLLCSIVLDLEAQDSFKVPRNDGSYIDGYLTVPDEKTFPAALILQGSDKKSVKNTYDKFLHPFSKIGIATLAIEKRGIYPDKPFNEKEYHLHNFLSNRVIDYQLVVNALYKMCENWNGKLIVIGGSSGGDAAVKLSSQIKESKLLVLISTGGGDINRNAMIDSFTLILEKQGVPKVKTKEYITRLNGQFDAMISNPTTRKMFEGYSYRWWAETLQYNPIDDLITYKHPIFLYHGSADIYCPVKYADLVATAFKQSGKDNLHYIRGEGCGHDVWTCQKFNVMKEITGWVQSNFQRVFTPGRNPPLRG